MQNNKRILIIDGMNEFLRHFCVNPSINENGIPFGGLIGFLSAFQKHIRDFDPSIVVICWESSGSGRKRQINKNYKEGRKPPKLNRFIQEQLSQGESEENKIFQVSRLTQYFDDLPIYQLIFDNIEADDLIAFISRLEMFVSFNKIILSSDKDFFQLLDNRTVIYRPAQKVILNTKRLLEKYGIHSNNFCLARSLSGDSSDNLKGVNGVGLKTVAKRFSFLSEEKNYSIQDIEKYCEEQIEYKSKLEVFKNVKNNIQKIKENYSLMQLFSPSMSIQSKDKIKNILLEGNLQFKKSSFEAKMIKDGFETNFEELYLWCRRVIDASR